MAQPVPKSLPIEPPDQSIDAVLSALAVRVRGGDEAAFEELFRACYAPLASVAVSFVKSREVAEELVQDTLLRVWRKRGTWEVRGSVRAYLYAAVRHRAISHLRKVIVETRTRDEAIAASLHSPANDHAPGAGARVESAELRDAVARAIAELPDRCREAFVLARQHELSHAEVAAIMGTSVRTVENHVARARVHLRLRLAPWLDG